MRPLSSSSCLEVWERGRRLHPLDGGLLALSFALPEIQPESLADWPLGRRNQALLELICCSFGPSLEAWTACAHCEETMELALNARDFLAGCAPIRADVLSDSSPVIVQGHAFRLPSSRDLAHISQGGLGTAAMRLIDHCQAGADDRLTSERLLPMQDEIEDAMAASDPLSEIRLVLRCPTCSAEWEEPLEVTTFLWAEIETRAKRLLLEVHTLASAYGWTETEVLSLGEARRDLYLEMVQGGSETTAQSPTRSRPLTMLAETVAR